MNKRQAKKLVKYLRKGPTKIQYWINLYTVLRRNRAKRAVVVERAKPWYPSEE